VTPYYQHNHTEEVQQLQGQVILIYLLEAGQKKMEGKFIVSITDNMDFFFFIILAGENE
jgi:hypothetical protein